MYKHLVIWKLVEKADAPQVVQAAQGVLAELRSSSPGLLTLELASTVGNDDTAGDLVLYSEFSSAAAYRDYDSSPGHQELKKVIGPYRKQRMGADYLVPDNR
jgi:heme-degrading monooxygenase HmoA